MAEDVDSECYDLLKNVDLPQEGSNITPFNRCSLTPSPHHDVSININDDCLTLKKVQFSRPPTKDICTLAVATFEKMDIQNLRKLEKMNDELKGEGQIGFDELKLFTTKIMLQVWNCEDELEELLRSDPLLTQALGKELLVLFDNVMSDPVYEMTKTGKPQRYTKACLDNSIQPIFEESIPENRWDTFETVISTYTSPTAFTPEMESLMRTAARLGISTDDLNLKKFVTERSLSAFLKTVIQAKMKKESFIKKFNSKLVGVLHHMPNLENKGVVNKFKYSFSKLYQYFDSKADSKSSPELHSKQNLTSRIDRSRYGIQKRDTMSGNERIGETFRTMGGRLKTHSTKKMDEVTSICHKCHEPYRERDISQVKCVSDICLSLPSCESITNCQCFDEARKTWDKRPTVIARPIFISSQNMPEFNLQKNQRKKRSNLKSSIKPTKGIINGKDSFGLITEQRSFFRLGEGALRDALSDYVETKSNLTSTYTKLSTKKKRVRWLDETSMNSVYGSAVDSDSENDMFSEHFPIYTTLPNTETTAERIISKMFCEYYNIGPLSLTEKPLNKVFSKAVFQATLVALFLWICFFMYSRTPDIADKLRQATSTSWLYQLKRKPIM